MDKKIMKLPNLPKIKEKQEADFGTDIFRPWWHKKRPRLKGTLELKDSKGAKSIPFNCLDTEQISFGTMAKSSDGILIRVTVGTPGTSDYIALCDQPTWVVIKFPDAFHIISVETFLLEKSRSKRRSLTSSRAKEISTISVPL
ncbi:MAG TPA: hypothetical protein V6D19_13075 [Stenomitos sp.]